MSRLKLDLFTPILFCLATMAACTGGTTSGGGGGGGVMPETCGNGQDEDQNGLADEGCGCTVGQSQACYLGPSDSRGVGACYDGTQQCVQNDEFFEWGPCVGGQGPADNDEFGDNVDSDCGGTDGPDENPSDCVANELGEGCFNGRDEDCDGLIDCEDPDCAVKCGERCVEGSDVCTNGIDNNCDELFPSFCDSVSCTDECGEGGPGASCVTSGQCADGLVCEDGVCSGGGGGPPVCAEETFEICDNRCDDDRDGREDCEDSDCAGSTDCSGAYCVGPALPDEFCWDGWDDDCDGFTDCADTDCTTSSDCNPSCECVPGQYRWCDTPTECSWGRQQCNPDGSWGSCVETSTRPAGCSGFFYDPACCAAAANACCQDYPAQGSIGECSGVVSCM